MTLRALRDALIRHGTFPLFTFGPGAAALGLVHLRETGALPSEAALVASAAGLIVLAYALLAMLERVLPHRAAWNEPQGDVRADLGYLLLVGPASALVGGVAAIGTALAVHAAFPAALRVDLWPSEWPRVVQILLACVIAELGHYAVHRLGHEAPLVWRLHAVHHSAARLYWMNATRFHPLDLVLISFFQVVPLEVLGIPPHTYLVYVVVSSCYGQLQHCNVDVDTRVYSWLFATPELHRWHHSTKPAEGDTNYGAILILWDVLFRTRFWPGRPITDPVGIGGMPHFPKRLVEQLWVPLRWRRLEGEGSGSDA